MRRSPSWVRLFAYVKSNWLYILIVGLIVLAVRYALDIYILVIRLNQYDVAATLKSGFLDLITLATSVLVEALPFLVAGTFIAVVIRLYAPERLMSKLLSLKVVPRRIILSLSGMLFPVCECGNVPVARGLMQRGATPGDAIAFLLAAPILNPIVIYTTVQAFGASSIVTYTRFAAAFLVAHLVAIMVPKMMGKRKIVTDQFAATCTDPHNHDHSFSESYIKELWPLMKMLILGAIIAAAVQVIVPRETIVAIGNDAILSVIVMIVLGFVISICSSVDAFFALAFARTFSSGALSAFLVSGPMVDIKMVILLRSTFTTRAIALICMLVFALVLAIGVTINTLGVS